MATKIVTGRDLFKVLGVDSKHEFTRAGITFKSDLADYPIEMIVKLMFHGDTQKVGDSAASAPKDAYEATTGKEWSKLDADARKEWRDSHEKVIAEHARAAMQSTRDNLVKNEWGVERSGDGMSVVDRYAASLCRQAVKARDAAKYKAAEEKERMTMCFEYFAGLTETQQDGLRKVATARIAAAEEKRKRDEEELARVAEEIGDLGIPIG